MDHISSIPPVLRPGLHVSDVIGRRGWKCDRYVQLVMMRSGTNTVEGLKFRMKAMTYGQALHQWVYNHIREALAWAYESRGYTIESIIEKELVQEESTGVVGTPDLVLKYQHVDFPEETFTAVYDIKSMSQSKWKRNQGKTGFRVEKEYIRQLGMYAEMLHADEAAFVYVVINDEPGKNRPDNHKLFQDQQKITHRVLPTVTERIYRLESIQAEGEYAAKTTTPSLCTDCPMKISCSRADRFMNNQ